MNRYQPRIARVAFGLAAMAMTAVTIGVLVVLPMTELAPDELIPLPVAQAVMPAFAETRSRPVCVDPAAAQVEDAVTSQASNGAAAPDAFRL